MEDWLRYIQIKSTFLHLPNNFVGISTLSCFFTCGELIYKRYGLDAKHFTVLKDPLDA